MPAESDFLRDVARNLKDTVLRGAGAVFHIIRSSVQSLVSASENAIRSQPASQSNPRRRLGPVAVAPLPLGSVHPGIAFPVPPISTTLRASSGSSSPASSSLLGRQHHVLASLKSNRFAAAALDSSVDLSHCLRFDHATLDPHTGGSYSDVYRATLPQGSGSIRVAIKVIRATGLGRTDNSESGIERRLAQRMVREMRVWKRLDHTRILPLLGYAMLDVGPCLISPWCTNGNILEYLKNHPDANRYVLVLQVGEGLVFLHSSNPPIVHSDLKANNILVSDTGEAMLSDFGLSKLLEGAPSGLSTSGMGLGALRWRAPELLTSSGEPTTRSDVYSFGCLALEIMTGSVPFKKHDSDGATICAKLFGEEIQPEDYPELDQKDPIWPVLARCWTRDPALRPIANDVLTELRVSLLS